MIEAIFSFLLFLFSFLISYAILIKIKIFPRATNIVISLVIAFYFLSASVFYKENLIQILGYSSLFIFFVFILALIYLSLRKEK